MSAFELQMLWLQKVCDFAKSKNRTPIFWDDMPLKFANLWPRVLENETEEELDKSWSTDKLDGAIALFPKDCIYMRWNYEDATYPAHRRLLNWYKDKGLKVMAATAASAGDSPFMPRENTKAKYIKGFSELVVENNLVGILATAWDDGSPHLETVWRGYIAQAEFGWNPKGRDVNEFVETHALREYGLPTNLRQMNFLKELEEAFFFFDDALVKSGRRNPAWGATNFTLIDLPDLNNPGKWSEDYREKINQAQKEEKRYHKIKKGLDDVKSLALRNRYTLDIYEQNNYLQNYPTQLILALYVVDSAKNADDRKSALKKLKDTCDGFDLMRENLEEVYSKTRFMEQPDGYIEDMNHHNHLSAKTQNSDWIYLYELPMVSKIKYWLKTTSNEN